MKVLKAQKPFRLALLSLLPCIIITLLAIASCENNLATPTISSSARNNVGNNQNLVMATSMVHNYAAIFDGGTDRYHSYQIPPLVKISNGT
jgi:hypothetical protein